MLDELQKKVVNYIQILYLCILKQLNPNISLLIN